MVPVLILSLALPFGVPARAQEQPANVVLTVIVENSYSEALPGAWVEILANARSKLRMADADGRVSFDLMRGSYKLIVSHEEYLAREANVLVNDDCIIRLTMGVAKVEETITVSTDLNGCTRTLGEMVGSAASEPMDDRSSFRSIRQEGLAPGLLEGDIRRASVRGADDLGPIISVVTREESDFGVKARLGLSPGGLRGSSPYAERFSLPSAAQNLHSIEVLADLSAQEGNLKLSWEEEALEPPSIFRFTDLRRLGEARRVHGQMIVRREFGRAEVLDLFYRNDELTSDVSVEESIGLAAAGVFKTSERRLGATLRTTRGLVGGKIAVEVGERVLHQEPPAELVTAFSSRAGVHFGSSMFVDVQAREGTRSELQFDVIRWLKRHVVSIGGGAELSDTFHLMTGNDGLIYDAEPAQREDGLLALDHLGNPVPQWRSNGPGRTLLHDFRRGLGAKREWVRSAFFVGDQWSLARRLTLGLGLRYEREDTIAVRDYLRLDAERLLSRVGLTWAPMWLSNSSLSASYGEYAGPLRERERPGLSPRRFVPHRILAYAGPEGNGLQFSPGFDLANYTPLVDYVPSSAHVDPGLRLPVQRDVRVSFTASGDIEGIRFGSMDYSVGGSLIGSRLEDLIDDKTEVVDGIEHVVIENTEKLDRRRKTGILDGRLVWRKSYWRIVLSGHWSHHFDDQGRLVSPGDPWMGMGPVDNYPGVWDESRAFPAGLLDGAFTDEATALSTLEWAGARYAVSAAIGAKYVSGMNFSLIDRAEVASGSSWPVMQEVYFGRAGAKSFDDSLIVGAMLRVKRGIVGVVLDVSNLLGSDEIVRGDARVFAVARKDDPALPAEFIPSANFGDAFGVESHVPGRAVSILIDVDWRGDQ